MFLPLLWCCNLRLLLWDPRLSNEYAPKLMDEPSHSPELVDGSERDESLRVVTSVNKLLMEKSFKEDGDWKAMVLKISCRKMLRLWFLKWVVENDVWLIETKEGISGWRAKGIFRMILNMLTFSAILLKHSKNDHLDKYHLKDTDLEKILLSLLGASQ